MPRVFMSHSSTDKPFVRRLAHYLEQHNIMVWIDEAELDIGDSLISRIGEGIYECDFIAAIISERSVDSAWVQKELQLAMTREITGKKIRVLPILVDYCAPKLPYYLRDKLYADFSRPNSFHDETERVLRAIIRRQESNVDLSLARPVGSLGDVNVGTVVHDRGDDFLGFQGVRFKRAFGVIFTAVGILIGIIASMIGSVFPAEVVAVRIILFSGWILALSGMLLALAQEFFKHSYDQDRNILLSIERIGGPKFPLFPKWWRFQYPLGKHNKAFKTAMVIEGSSQSATLLSMGLIIIACKLLIEHKGVSFIN